MTSNVQSKITGSRAKYEFFLSAKMNPKTLSCIRISKTWANGGFYYEGDRVEEPLSAIVIKKGVELRGFNGGVS
jgi:hypothetical protein